MEILNNEYQDLIDYLNDCSQACYELFDEALGSHEVAKRVKEAHFLIETAMFCQQTVAFISLQSEHLKEMVLTATHMLKTTANECNHFSDESSKLCAQVCLEAAHYAVDLFKDTQIGENGPKE
jgi:hypothetical protein